MPRNPHSLNAARPEWPEAQTELLKTLWAEGKSGTEIAAAIADQFGTRLSRNSVIGKVHRLKLPARPKEVVTIAQKRSGRKAAKRLAKPKPAKRVTLPPLPINRPEIAADAPPPRAAAFVALPGTTPKSLTDLAVRGECRWPIGENPTLFCGCATDGVYCTAHAAMAYRPVEKVKK
jgi:GcrA cell cycle regulator